MTITYPRVFPSLYVGGGRFVLERNDAMTPDNAGAMGGLHIGYPTWRFEHELVALSDDDAVAWQAWIDSLEGPTNGFMAHDFRRMLPRAYLGSGPPRYTGAGLPATRHSGGAFDGSATSYELDDAREVLELTGMPSTFELRAGDFVGFKGGDGNLKRAKVKVIEGATAVDGVLSVRVTPAVDALIDDWSSVKAHIDAPACTMKLLPETTISDTSPTGEMSGRIVARQYLEE